MHQQDILRYVHHVGSPVTGSVIDRTEVTMSHGSPCGHLTLRTASAYPAILSYDRLTDDRASCSPDLIPQIGDTLTAVVFNFVDDTLILTATPRDLAPASIAAWRQFYAYVDTLTVGEHITGVVTQVMPFGLFVNIGAPYRGLIDYGHTVMAAALNRGHALPHDYAAWPTVGDTIQCIIGYIRFRNQQIGLLWNPDRSA